MCTSNCALRAALALYNKAEETYLLNPAVTVATVKGASIQRGIYEHITLLSLMTLMANNFANFIDHTIRTDKRVTDLWRVC